MPYENLSSTSISDKDLKLAAICEDCVLCSRARIKQRGVAYFFVRFLEGGVCPACAAYERVHGRKAHESSP